MTAMENLRCSFCGKASTEVERLVAGPGVQICNECVGLAQSVIRGFTGQKADLSRPMWTTMTDEEMLAHIPGVAKVADQVEADLRSWVQELRRRNVTWARIGAALGVTRQSAWERFSGEE